LQKVTERSYSGVLASTLQGFHISAQYSRCYTHRYTPGSGKALAVVLAMRGGMADNIRRRMGWADRLALNVVGGLVLPLTVAGEEQKVCLCSTYLLSLYPRS
jgi:hypothetical protein